MTYVTNTLESENKKIKTLENDNSKSIALVSKSTKDTQYETNNSNKNNYSTCAISSTIKWKTSEVNYVNTKALDEHLNNPKNLGETF